MPLCLKRSGERCYVFRRLLFVTTIVITAISESFTLTYIIRAKYYEHFALF